MEPIDLREALVMEKRQATGIRKAMKIEQIACLDALLDSQPCSDAPVDVDSGEDVSEQLWKDTGGIVPSTGKSWLTGRMLREANAEAETSERSE